MKQIGIADRTLCREGVSIGFKEKIEIARQLERLRVDVIELPVIKNIRTDTLLIRTVSSMMKTSVLSVAAGVDEESIRNAAVALENAGKPRIRVELPMSPVGMEYVCHRKPPKMLEWIGQAVGLAASLCGDVEFCATDATRAEGDFLQNAIRTAIGAGAKEITICDDEGKLMPDEFSDFVAGAIDGVTVPAAIRCCDRHGMACANALLGVKAGATAVKTAVGGEFTSLETFADLLRNFGDTYGISTGIRATELHRNVGQIAWILGNGGGQEKGGVAAPRKEESAIRLDKNDNRDAVILATAKLGYDLSDEDCDKVYAEFLRVAEKKTVGARELDAIVTSSAMQAPATFVLDKFLINNSNFSPATAFIALKKGDEIVEGVSMGDGPVDAAFLALEQLTGHHYEVDDFQVSAVTEGQEAMGSAWIKLRSNGKLYAGHGISTDIVAASIRAYINAVNKIVYEEELV